jgi:hypothetical protein
MGWNSKRGAPWSKLKRQFEGRLAQGFQGRLRVHVTEYRTNSMDVGRGWITLDGEEVCSVQIPSFYDDNIGFDTNTLDFGAAVGVYVDLSVDEAMTSRHPIVQALAFLDKKMGKRRLARVDAAELHEFPRITYRLRCQMEGISGAT